MNLKHNYTGKRGVFGQPSYIHYCVGKCYYIINRLKKYHVVGGSIGRGMYGRIAKYIRTDENKQQRLTNKRLWWGRNKKYH
jgi:hypothetical protein